jgi:hypothetical protein
MGFLKNLFGGGAKAPTPELSDGAEGAPGVVGANLRSASIAEIGKLPPPDDPLASCYGGHGVALPSEPLPDYYEGAPMFPLLQVNCGELPFVPAELAGVALFVLWVSNRAINAISYGTHDQGIVVREYKTLKGLAPVSDIEKPRGLKPQGVKWTLVQDAPIRAGAREKSVNHRGTKIGGYPTVLYDDLSESSAKGTYVFQVPCRSNWNPLGHIWIKDFDFAYFLRSESGGWQWDVQ